MKAIVKKWFSVPGFAAHNLIDAMNADQIGP